VDPLDAQAVLEPLGGAAQLHVPSERGEVRDAGEALEEEAEVVHEGPVVGVEDGAGAGRGGDVGDEVLPDLEGPSGIAAGPRGPAESGVEHHTSHQW
jgi:hypothetical protein